MSDNLPEITTERSLVDAEAGVIAASSREQYEIQAACVMARKFPRDENAALAKIMNSLSRPGMAEDAVYAFPRGGKTISGPSAPLAREMARCWGNIRQGMGVVQMDEEWVLIRGYAIDVETNTWIALEDKFRRLIQRKINNVTQWVKPDERDLRELINRRGAILVRNCILQVIPRDIIDQAVDKSRSTVEAYNKNQLKTSREDIIRALVLSFDNLGIKTEHLEKYLGHPLSVIDEKELTELRGVRKSISDGNSRVSDHFDFSEGVADSSPTADTKGLTEKILKGSSDKKKGAEV